MAKTKSIDRPSLDYLSWKGPHQVAFGRTDEVGMTGLVFTPVSGADLPVVALGPGWLQPAHRYSDTMRYLASWGFLVVAPDTGKGPIPDPGGLARDLRDALELMTVARLGGDRIRADSDRLGVLGHSVGGGAAVLAAADDPAIGAVVTVTAAATTPSAVEAATRVRVPGLHLVGSDDEMAGEGVDSAGAAIAAAWAGDAQLRTIKGVGHYGLPEGKHWSTALMGSSGVKKAQQVTRALASAWFLRHLAGQEQLADDLEGKFSGTTVEDLDEVRESLRDED